MNNPADTLAALAGGHLSHEEVANKVRMLMRTDLDHEAVCTIARDRIKWLASRVAEMESATASLKGEAVMAALKALPRIIPADMDREEIWRANGEYVSLESVISVVTPPAPQAAGEVEFQEGWERCDSCGGLVCCPTCDATPTPSPAPQGGGDLRVRHIGGGLLALYRGDEQVREIGVTPGWDFRDRDEFIARYNATPPAQQPGEVGGVRVTHQMILRAQAAVPSRGNAPAIYYSETQAILEAALAPKEKGNG